MTPLRRKLRKASELGATTAEYAGVIVAAVTLVLALIVAATPIGEKLTCEIGSALDKVVGGEGYACESASGANSQYEVDPSEIAKSSTERTKSTKAGAAGKVGPGELSVEGTDSVSATKTEYYDGTGSRSMRTSQELSGEYSLGTGSGSGDGDAGDDPFSAEVEFNGGIAVSRTEEKTWNCGGEGERSCEDFDDANADAVEDQLNNQGISRLGNHGREIDEDPDATSTSWNVKLTLGGKASATADGVGASVDISGEVAYTRTDSVEKDGDGEGDDAHETSHRFAYKGEYGAGLDVESAFGLSNGESNSYAGSYEVTYDEDGKLKTITFTSIVEGTRSGGVSAEDSGISAGADGEATQTSTVTTTLDVSSLSESDRKIAEEYASSSLTNGALTVPESALNPSKPSDNDFDNLLYERAKVTRITEEGAKITESGGFDLWVVNYERSEEISASNTTRVEVLGEPGADGARNYKESELP